MADGWRIRQSVSVTVDGPALADVEGCLARLDADRHGAVVHRRDDAVRAEARDLDRRVWRGEPTGPLAGWCFTVKAALDNGRLPATAGSLLLDDRVRRAAPVVQRFLDADALLVGVTNCAEMALSPDGSSRRYGQTDNPAAPGRSPGGSSAGCAAAVAAGLVPFSVGTDYGGSVRYPACCTGTYGFRPATSTVPRSGQVPAAPPRSARARFSVPGILAADVATLAAAVRVILSRAVVARRPPRIAWAADDGSVLIAGEVVEAVRRAAAVLGARPATELGGNPLVGADDAFTRIRAADDLEPIRTLAGDRADRLTERLRAILTQPVVALNPTVEATARRLRAESRRWFARCPLLVVPVAATVAPPVGELTAFEALAPSRAVSLLGLPALAVPAGRDAHRVPIGVQLVGQVGAVLWGAQQLADMRWAA
jgi:amidase